MKKRKNSGKALLFAAVMLAVWTLGFSSLSAEAAPKLSSTKLVLSKGEKKTIRLKGEKKKITWQSTRSQVASVSKKGRITAKKKGRTVVIAKAGKKKYRCKVTVEEPKLNQTRMQLEKGKSIRLKLTGTERKVSWKSSRKNIATVGKKGLVTGKRKGSAVITATVGGKKYSCKVTVVFAQKPETPQKPENPTVPEPSPKPVIPAESVSLDKSELTLTNGYSEKLTAHILPVNTTDQTLVWKSSNTGVAVVSQDGEVTACGVGTAEIRVSCQGRTASCKVQVIPEEPKISIRLLADTYNTAFYLRLLMTNYGRKPLIIDGEIRFLWDGKELPLYLNDNGVFVDSYTMNSSSFLEIPACQKSFDEFAYSLRGDFTFRITYDGISYQGKADYYGEEVTLTKESAF